MVTPFFSVIIPVYNGAATIERAIKSILSQSFRATEVIVVDDGSTDNTKEVVGAIQDERLHWLSQTNAGAAAARNYGVATARGKFLLFLDADDWVNEQYLENFFKVLSQGSFGLAMCDIKYVSPSGKVEKVVPPWRNDTTLSYGICGSFVIDYELFLALGGYDALLSYSENTDLFLRLELSRKISMRQVAIVEGACVFIGTTDRRVRSAKYRDKKFNSLGHFMRKHEEFFRQSPKYSSIFKRIYVASAIQSNNYSTARQKVKELLAQNPFSLRTYALYFLVRLPFLARLYYRFR